MLDRINGVSTMIERCTAFNTEYKCVGFNFEVYLSFINLFFLNILIICI